MRISALQSLAGLAWAPRFLPAQNILWFCKISVPQLFCFLAVFSAISYLWGLCLYPGVVFVLGTCGCSCTPIRRGNRHVQLLYGALTLQSASS